MLHLRRVTKSLNLISSRQLAVRSHVRCFADEAKRPLQRQDSEMLLMNNVVDPQTEELIDMLQKEQMTSAETQVPWFLENMPKDYFRQVSEDLRNQHLRGITAIYDADAVADLTLKSDNGNTLSVISGGKNTPKKLASQLASIGANDPLTGLSVFSSSDDTLSLNIFNFGNNKIANAAQASLTVELKSYIKDLQSGKYANDPKHATPSPYFEEAALTEFVKKNCTQSYINGSSPRRLCKQIQLYHDILKRGTDEVGLDIETPWAGKNTDMMITLAITNVLATPALRRITNYCAGKSLSIGRTHLDLIKGSHTKAGCDARDMLCSNTVSMFRILVSADEGADMEAIRKTLTTDLPVVAKWSDERALELMNAHGVSAVESDVMVALCDLSHAVLAYKDPFEFSRSNIQSIAFNDSRFMYTRAIAELFLKRFDPHNTHPEQDDAVFASKIEDIKRQINSSGELNTAQQVYQTMLDAVKATYRTNAYVPHRFGLSLRLDPSMCVEFLLDGSLRKEVPYGIFFVHGRRFAGFQLRFRDISRGGLRVVTPRNKEIHGIESARQLQECYDLAFAQQLKNKDIAEGGSKAVCLVDTEGIHGKHEMDHVIRKSLKAMVNSVLDVITPKDAHYVRDYLKKSEHIYFGPDEQVTPEHIEWMIQRAQEREYPTARAFMSSKPDAGINHKVYGVTSEGVAVFLDEALRATGVDTSKPFTVKITGGPDGDVAGNMLKILHRQYGDNARIVGLADGTASLEDPDGVNWSELLRLFKEALPLSSFSKDKFGPNSKLYLCDTPEGIHKRNTMHNRVVADAFVPGGGRPATINDSNWKNFLKEDGTPSSPLIVEGANLFLTHGARSKLHEHGCVIVKDSSANKCGVICSSFEVIASMLLEKEEFLAVKEELVHDVLDGLRLRAQREAELMFREYKLNPALPLPPVSEKISRAINRSTDLMGEYLEKLSAEEIHELLPIIRDSLPKKLMDVGFDRFEKEVPPAYIRMQLACIIASEIVYREGIDYAMSIHDEMIPTILLKYITNSTSVSNLGDKLASGEALTESERALASKILKLGGARTIIDHHLQ